MSGESKDPSRLEIAEQGYLFAGGDYHAMPDGGHIMVGQAYVEFQIPFEQRHPFPLVMIHGRGQSGTNFTGTPDGRPGWAQFFLSRGYAVYVMDQPGRGRSVYEPSVYGPLLRNASERLSKRFTAPAKWKLWPQAELHSQWPGTGEPGDPIFDQFYASQVPSMDNQLLTQQLTRNACVALLDRIGPAILLTHSQSGAIGWLIGDARPHLVKGIVAVEPGCAVGDVEFVGAPEWFKYSVNQRPWGLAGCNLTYEPAVASPEELEFVLEDRAQSAGLARVWKQKHPARRLVNLARIPIMIVTGEASYHAVYDHGTSQFLTQAGVQNTHICLTDRNIRGNGHMMMLEKNSDAIATVIDGWIETSIGR